MLILIDFVGVLVCMDLDIDIIIRGVVNFGGWFKFIIDSYLIKYSI